MNPTPTQSKNRTLLTSLLASLPPPSLPPRETTTWSFVCIIPTLFFKKMVSQLPIHVWTPNCYVLVALEFLKASNRVGLAFSAQSHKAVFNTPCCEHASLFIPSPAKGHLGVSVLGYCEQWCYEPSWNTSTFAGCIPGSGTARWAVGIGASFFFSCIVRHVGS